MALVAPPLQPPASLRRSIDQDMPHRERRDGEEVCTVAPLRLRLVDEFNVGLVDERGRRERAAAATHRELSEWAMARSSAYTIGTSRSSGSEAPLRSSPSMSVRAVEPSISR